jgi:hypothetical protein
MRTGGFELGSSALTLKWLHPEDLYIVASIKLMNYEFLVIMKKYYMPP